MARVVHSTGEGGTKKHVEPDARRSDERRVPGPYIIESRSPSPMEEPSAPPLPPGYDDGFENYDDEEYWAFQRKYADWLKKVESGEINPSDEERERMKRLLRKYVGKHRAWMDIKEGRNVIPPPYPPRPDKPPAYPPRPKRPDVPPPVIVVESDDEPAPPPEPPPEPAPGPAPAPAPAPPPPPPVIIVTPNDPGKEPQGKKASGNLLEQIRAGKKLKKREQPPPEEGPKKGSDMAEALAKRMSTWNYSSDEESSTGSWSE